jgi:hypothetical protein
MFHRKRRHSSSGHSLAVEDSVTFILLATLLALAPWIRGGNRQIAMLVLLGIALLLLANLAAQFSYQLIKPRLQPFANNAVGQLSAMSALRLPRWKWVLIFLLATSPQWLGLVQLVPIPVDWWAHLPGRQPYLAAQQAAGIVTPASLPLSLNPLATQASILASIPVAAVFLASVLLPAIHGVPPHQAAPRYGHGPSCSV